ncbi:hypothetical protein ABH922_003026 [Rhodococcus sp. 27YEA15]|uniref:hypothetical protein n=1 Tax=Rhodococcus sp. 27YEA15 TaxID=3156259 RepID=UPI003C7B6966
MTDIYVILETGQGGGIPDHVYGPYWGRDDGVEDLKSLRESAAMLRRRDRFQLARVEVEE